jgi:formylglycine-generating enzyme required for sulfatase activity
MAETEMTQELWSTIWSNPSYWKGAKRPVEWVQWYAAMGFCNKLSLAAGRTPVYNITKETVNWSTLTYAQVPKTVQNNAWTDVKIVSGANGYRLPTEMEWMWARMGADTDNPGQLNTTGYKKPFAGSNGSNSIGNYAWIPGKNGQHQNVAQKLPNELGLYDMTGNVREWCWDRYVAWPAGTLTDYIGPGAGNGHEHVYRGTQYWGEADSGVNDSTRSHTDPKDWDFGDDTGFRVVLPQ